MQCAGQRSSCEDGCCPTFLEALEKLGSTCHAETTASTDPRGVATTVVEVVTTNAAAIFISELPARAIARCRAGPSLLAYVLVSKYADHIPWNRMEKIFARENLELARSTLCDWSMASAEVLKAIVTAMHHDAKRNAFCICIDATGVMVQQKERCRWGHFWLCAGRCVERLRGPVRPRERHRGRVLGARQEVLPQGSAF